MEDIKRRLEVKHPPIQIQAVWRLYSDVVKKSGKTVIDASTPEITELKALWDSCSSPDRIVSEASGQALVKLVVIRKADFTYVINSLLNIVPSARSLQGVVPAISKLVTLQAEAVIEAKQNYECPYSIRTPPHPFITVLTNRPESWLLLQQQVYAICCHDNERIRQIAIRVISPFLKFVFLEPQQTAQYQPMRNGLQRALIDVCFDATDRDAKKVVSFLASVLHCFQMQTFDYLANLTVFLLDILRTATRLTWSPTEMSTLAGLVSCCLGSLQPCWTVGIDTARLEKAVLLCVEKHPQAVCSEKNIPALSELLVSADSTRCLYLLQIVNLLLTNLDPCPSTLAAMLVQPLLQILSAPASAEAMSTCRKQVMVAAADDLATIEQIIKNCVKGSSRQESVPLPSATPNGYTNQMYVSLAWTFGHSESTACIWLENVTTNIASSKMVPLNVASLTAALFVVPSSKELSEQALETIVEIAKRDYSQAPGLLPLLLYRLGREADPEMKLAIMEAIPQLATHKFCIAPILKTIQLMSNSPRLRAISIRLMTSLWKLQDRTFPQLLALLTEESPGRMGPGGIDEVTLAKAAAIRDICQMRPGQHGSDLLSPISDILNSHSGEEGSAACALVLEGLASLCEAEVINIRSAWSVLADKLTQDCRPPVVEKICDLFSLVASLAEKTPEFESFQVEVVRNLWLYCHSDNTTIQGAALRALSAFSPDQFLVSFLPAQVTEDLREQAAQIAAQQDDPDLTIDQILTFIPGVCYTRLLKTLHAQVLEDYEVFLSSMVGKEVESLPRGIYHSSLRRQGAAANQGKAVSGIPGFILSQYEKTNQPGLRPGLASGLLFCYDPPVEVGRDGRPRRHYIVSHGKNYQQMFTTLLSEVQSVCPVQPSEWHRCMLMPQAWTSFVDRLFTAMLEAKKADVELEIKRGDIEPGDAKLAQDTAWLWVRDAIADLIKTASRGNPTGQGNSVLALAGLAVAASRHATGLDEESLKAAEDTCQHLSHSHWLTVAMDTIMCLMEVSFKPKGKILGLCQQRTAGDKLPASLLARSSACVALSQLVPIFITRDSDRIYQVISMATDRLPGQPACEESPVLQFHYGLGLGMFLSRLFEEHISDVGGAKGMNEIWKTMDVLENCCLSQDLENRSGCMLGVGLAVSGLCEDGKTESRAHVSAVHDKLVMLMETTPPTDSSYQALCVAVSCISGRAFSVNILQIERVGALVDSLTQAHTQNPEVTGVCLALGALCYNLNKVGHPTIGQLRTKLVHDWLKGLASEETPPRQKVSTLNGLMALIGSERTLVSVQGSGASLLGSDVDADSVIKMATSVVANSSDLGIQSNSAWMLGHLYLSACAITETRASVPPSYGYLPESSILRAMVDLLIEAGKRGPEVIPPEYVKVALTAIQEDVKQVLPPVNWAGVLSPFMRVNFGTSVRCLCFKMAVSQSLSAPTAAMFISSWLTPPLFNSLDAECKQFLYQSLPYLIKSVGPAILQTFLERGCMEPFTDINIPMCICVLRGVGLYCQMSECLSNLLDEILDEVTLEDFNEKQTFVKGTFVRCYLIANGRQPVALLNSCIDAIIHSQHSEKTLLLHLLANCFHQMAGCSTDYTSPVNRTQWLLELLGHVRNIAVGNTTLPDEAPPRIEVMQCAVEVVARAMCLWTNSAAGAISGVELSLFKPTTGDEAPRRDSWVADYANMLPDCLDFLPGCIPRLEREPWDQIMSKAIDWLLTLSERSTEVVSPVTSKQTRESLYMLRHCKDFRKAVVWSRVFNSDVTASG
ncbi:focadhesin-like [Haliotis rubra]|uniref:focadhesin-like n=1 Tax=Haliotis rubra TaxID=36100 RepID=UPI001EE586FA|nr:focadhesin-like [Haliotis rubra]